MQIINKLPKPLHNVLSFCANCIRHSPRFAWLYANRFKGLTKSQIEHCLSCMFRKAVGYPLNLTNPKSFNEKLQWLNLNYHDPLIQTCADKVLVRDYISKTVGAEYLVPVLGVYDSADEIDFDSLPNKFVLKVNWGSGQNIICTDKSVLDIPAARNKLRNWMQPTANHYYDFFEWCYKDIKPKIVAEHFIDFEKDLPDYKFICLNGQAKIMFIAQNRHLGHESFRVTFFDRDFQKLPFKRMYDYNGFAISKPPLWDKMIQIAEVIAKRFPLVRVDFYIVNNTLKIGELTFFPGAGLEPFEPVEWDYRLGELLKLPESKP